MHFNDYHSGRIRALPSIWISSDEFCSFRLVHRSMIIHFHHMKISLNIKSNVEIPEKSLKCYNKFYNVVRCKLNPIAFINFSVDSIVVEPMIRWQYLYQISNKSSLSTHHQHSSSSKPRISFLNRNSNKNFYSAFFYFLPYHNSTSRRNKQKHENSIISQIGICWSHLKRRSAHAQWELKHLFFAQIENPNTHAHTVKKKEEEDLGIGVQT